MEFAVKFREEFICLTCRTIYTLPRKECCEVLANGKICGGAICPRIIRVY